MGSATWGHVATFIVDVTACVLFAVRVGAAFHMDQANSPLSGCLRA